MPTVFKPIIMTPLTDVRPGNKVLHNASGITATVLHVENERIELESFPGSLYCAVTDISGIELTNDMLQKLFFSNEVEWTKWSGHGINIQKKRDGFYYGLRITKNRCKIQHLHQLQNYTEQIEKFFSSKAKLNSLIRIDFKNRNSIVGIFIQTPDFNDLKLKNFWRIVSEAHFEQWKQSKDYNLVRMFNGAEFTKLAIV
ncbi:hypothetical protein HMI54_011085 [Coelomomyces lativittatus]|nr:hypothetical protein HMI54_011085 [Coelomomyces lativittatus]